MVRKVVITGLGLAAPLGLEIEEIWENALNGISGIKKLDRRLGNPPIGVAGQVSSEDWGRICSEFPVEAESEGERRTLFALWAAEKARSDARLENGFGERSRFGVAFASGIGIWRLEDAHRWIGEDGEFDSVWFAREIDRVHRESFIRNNSSRPAEIISEKFRMFGSNATITSACAAATQAIGLAFRTIQRGEADIVMAGGSDSMLDPFALAGLVLLGSTAVSQGDETICRPFDRKRSGLVIGEGAGAVVLEEESHARMRGARIYAEVAGYASTIDAYRLTAPHPEGRGAEQSMRRAMADAGIGPDEIDYINAHGTSTKLNDLAETIAIRKVFGEAADRVAVSSSKLLIGHLMAAAGAPEFVFTVLSVSRDRIHPTINLTNPDPKCDLDYVPNVSRSTRVRAALSNSFGFGGQNATIVVRKYGG